MKRILQLHIQSKVCHKRKKALIRKSLTDQSFFNFKESDGNYFESDSYFAVPVSSAIAFWKTAVFSLASA